MARLTRAGKKEETRKALIRSAASCFARVGFEASTIDMIAEDADFSRGAFYSHFSSKDEIFLLLLSEHLEADLATLGPALQKVCSPKELIERTQSRYRNLGKDEDWCLLFSEFQLYVMRDGMEAAEFKNLFDDYRAKLGVLIKECCDRIDLKLKITPYELVVSQLAIAHGLSLQRVSNPSIRQSLAADALSIFTSGAQKT